MEDSFSNQINNAYDSESTPYVAPADPRASLARKLALIFVSVSLVLSGVTSVSLLNSDGDDYAFSSDFGTDTFDDTTEDEDLWDVSWAPAGFTPWIDDSSLAYRYSEISEYECTDYNCLEISFVSQYDCSSNFYVAANYLDGPDGTVIGYDNASVPSIRGGQVARFIFEDTSNTSVNWEIAEISCY